MKQEILRLPAEQLFQKEIDALIAAEKDPVPTGWKMSPRSVRTYICGGKVGRTQITPKYIGHERLVEIAISTLVTDRALLLIGEPGTAKSWLSEHLCAAINGDSTKVIQGTAGTTEEQLRYSWNYAMLLAQGPSEAAMLKSPVFTAMETGTIARMEEISRCASEVQDALISILSEKRISVPELNTEIAAKKGFSVIATANTRDKGVNELRCGETIDRSQKVKGTSGVLSTAEAISLLCNSMALAGSFGSGKISDEDLAAALQGAIIKDEDKDAVAWKEYLEHVMKKRGLHWSGLYKACSDLMR